MTEDQAGRQLFCERLRMHAHTGKFKDRECCDDLVRAAAIIEAQGKALDTAQTLVDTYPWGRKQ
jgi:hypothetical protein